MIIRPPGSYGPDGRGWPRPYRRGGAMSEDAGFEGDGGLPPGGAPEQQPCACGPCPEPACGKTCTRPFLHTPSHMCPLGHTW